MSFEEKVQTTVGRQWDIYSPKGDCGIEIEIEGDNLPQGLITKNFVGKGDGSLRNGAEYVSGVLWRREVGREVNLLQTTLGKVGAVFQPSYRCSTHIHENYVNETFHSVLGAYVIWALVEPSVFRMIPAGRDGSLFCVPSYDAGDVPTFIDRFCKDIAGGFRNGFRPRGKYASQNITRLGPGEAPAIGTLEYRIFPYTMDGDTIQQWCDWLGNLRGIVAAEKDPTFIGLVRWAEKNPLDFLGRVFGKVPFSKEEAGNLVDFGARQAYEIARVINAAYKMKVVKERKKPTLMVGDEMPMHIDEFIPRVAEAEVAPAEPVNPFPPARPARRNEPPVEAVAGADQRRWERRLRIARAAGDAERAERAERRLAELLGRNG